MLRRDSGGQLQIELRSHAWQTFDSQGSVDESCQSVRDREPKSRTSRFTSQRTIRLPKRIEDARSVLGCDADSSICDLDSSPYVDLPAGVDADFSVSRAGDTRSSNVIFCQIFPDRPVTSVSTSFTVLSTTGSLKY